MNFKSHLSTETCHSASGTIRTRLMARFLADCGAQPRLTRIRTLKLREGKHLLDDAVK